MRFGPVATVIVSLSIVAGCGTSRPVTAAPGKEANVTCRENLAAPTKGVLPATGTPTVAGVALPAGAQKTPDPSFLTRGRPGPALWVTDQAAPPSLWAQLVNAFPQTGLWPVWVEELDDPHQAGRPWDSGEFDPDDTAKIDAVDPAHWLTDQSHGEIDPDIPVDQRPPKFLGLAAHESTCTRRLDDFIPSLPKHLRLALIPATRPADVITEIGWSGTVNAVDDNEAYSSLLRSWEDRFGAYVIDLGFDTLTVGFQRLPQSEPQLRRLAAEIYYLCPDLVDQGSGHVSDLAKQLGADHSVQCWWD